MHTTPEPPVSGRVALKELREREPSIYTLPNIADHLGVDYRVLQTWLEAGLIAPSVQRSTGHGVPNLYSEVDRDRIARLVALRQAGLSMDGLRAVIESPWPLITALKDWAEIYA